jgi:hypothetical protein
VIPELDRKGKHFQEGTGRFPHPFQRNGNKKYMELMICTDKSSGILINTSLLNYMHKR